MGAKLSLSERMERAKSVFAKAQERAAREKEEEITAYTKIVRAHMEKRIYRCIVYSVDKGWITADKPTFAMVFETEAFYARPIIPQTGQWERDVCEAVTRRLNTEDPSLVWSNLGLVMNSSNEKYAKFTVTGSVTRVP